MSCACPDTNNPSGNDIQAQIHIPLKVGEPLSSLNDRAVIMGSIPEVIRHPAFTLVGGGTVENKIANGGIQSLSSFFKNRQGTYFNKNAQLAANCCE